MHIWNGHTNTANLHLHRRRLLFLTNIPGNNPSDNRQQRCLFHAGASRGTRLLLSQRRIVQQGFLKQTHRSVSQPCFVVSFMSRSSARFRHAGLQGSRLSLGFSMPASQAIAATQRPTCSDDGAARRENMGGE